MGLGFGFVVPRFFDLYNAWCPWDTSALNYPTGERYSTEEQCQKSCDEHNVMWYEKQGEKLRVIYKRTQYKNWKAVNLIARRVGYDDEDGVPYIDTNLKKNILPNLFNRIAYHRDCLKDMTDKAYSIYYKCLSKECE